MKSTFALTYDSHSSFLEPSTWNIHSWNWDAASLQYTLDFGHIVEENVKCLNFYADYKLKL